MWVPILIAVLMLVGAGVHRYTHQNDSAVEQVVEEVLKVEGVDIDFSAADKAAEPKP